jgi:hypothetical protein
MFLSVTRLALVGKQGLQRSELLTALPARLILLSVTRFVFVIEQLLKAEPLTMRHGEIAAFLGVTRQRAVQLSAMDGFPPAQEIAGRPMWRTETIEAWAEANWWGTRPWRVRPYE